MMQKASYGNEDPSKRLNLCFYGRFEEEWKVVER